MIFSGLFDSGSASGGGVSRAQIINVTVPLTTGLLTTVSTFGLLAPVAFAPTGGNANITVNASTGGLSATVALTAGATQSKTGTATGADGVIIPWTANLTGQVTLVALSIPTTGGISTPIAISGASSGSTITSPDIGSHGTIDSAGRTVTFDAVGAYSFTLVETLSGASGSPKSTPVSVTVSLAVFTQPYNRLIMNPVGDSRPAQSGGDSGTIGTTDFNRAVNATGPMAFLPMLSGNRIRWNGGPNLGVGGEAVEGSLGVPRPLGTGNNPVFNGSIAGTTLTISAFTAGTNILAAGQRIGGAGTGINRDTFLVSGAGNTWTVTPSQTVASFTGAQAGNPAIDIVAFAARVEANIPFMMGTNSSDAAISPGGAAQVIYQQAIRALTDPTYVYPPYGAVLPLYGGLPKNLWLIDEEPQGIDSTGSVANARTLSRVGFIQGWSDFVRKFAYNSGDALANPHVYVAPLWDDPLFLDAATGANHRNIAGLLADGLHNGGAGAYEQSRLMSVGVNALLDTSTNFAHLADTTQQNTLACLITNGCFTGTAGGTAGLSGTLVGSIPTGWNFGFGGDAALTYTATQTALGGNLGNSFKVRITGTIASTTSINFQSSFGSIISSVNCATDTFRMCSMLKLTMTSGGLFNLGPTVYMNVPGTGHYFVLGDSATGSPTYSGGNFTYWKQQAADASHDWLTLASADMDWPGRGFTGAPSGGNTGWDIGIAPGAVDITIEWRQHTVALVTD